MDAPPFTTKSYTWSMADQKRGLDMLDAASLAHTITAAWNVGIVDSALRHIRTTLRSPDRVARMIADSFDEDYLTHADYAIADIETLLDLSLLCSPEQGHRLIDVVERWVREADDDVFLDISSRQDEK